MANFSQLSEQDVVGLAETFGLGALDSWSTIEAGTVNSNFALRCASGRYFLRINEGKDEAAVAYEASLVSGLAELGVPTPVPVLAGERRYADHRGQWASVFPWVEGGHVARADVSPVIARAVGAGLANLHAAADQVTGLAPHEGIYTTRAIAERARGFASSNDPALAEVNLLLADETRWLFAQPEPRDRGVIHGDLFRDNVLFASETLCAFLDFEQASMGSRTYDLAVCINAWCYDQAMAPELVAAMIAGYRATRATEPEPFTTQALWTELRRSAWRFTITRITDLHLRGIVDPDKDFRRYAARLVSWRELGADGLEGWLVA